MNKQFFNFIIGVLIYTSGFAQNSGNQPTPPKNSKPIITNTPVKPGVVQQSNPEANESYTLEFTAILIEGRKKINLATKKVIINILFTDGFYTTLNVDRTNNTQTFGVARCSRKLSDTGISRIEVIYVNKNQNNSRDEWELFDVLVRGFAYIATDDSKNFLWETRNYFPGLQILLPGQVAESLVRRPMRLSNYALNNSYISMLYPQFIIGNDDIRDNYSALNMVITTKSNPSLVRKSPVAPKPQYRGRLKGAYSFFSLSYAEAQSCFPFSQEWRDAGNNKIPLGAKIADLNKISMEYEFGDHGPFENDDWELVGICLNVQMQNNTGYRYYTNWKLNKRMNRSSKVELQ
jgi:hypothetical protein